MPYFQEDCALPLHVVYRQCETLLGSVARTEEKQGRVRTEGCLRFEV